MAEYNFQIKHMPRASVLEDGTLVEMELETTSGDKVILSFDPDSLDRWAGRAVQLVNKARIDKLAKGGHASIPIVPLVAVAIDVPVDGSTIAMMVRGSNGVPQTFGLTHAQGDQLARQLPPAIAKARERAAQTRQ